jgi:hypothetical protein
MVFLGKEQLELGNIIERGCNSKKARIMAHEPVEYSSIAWRCGQA